MVFEAGDIGWSRAVKIHCRVRMDIEDLQEY